MIHLQIAFNPYSPWKNIHLVNYQDRSSGTIRGTAPLSNSPARQLVGKTRWVFRRPNGLSTEWFYTDLSFGFIESFIKRLLDSL
jgi:hypothetical protein